MGAGRGEAALVAVLLAAWYLATNLSDGLLVGAFADDGVYVTLGKALAGGYGYRSLHLLGAPVQVKYPPGFPLILAGLWRVGHTVTAVQRLVALIHPLVIGATAGFLWWIGRRRLAVPRPLLALLVVLPLVLDPAITYYTIPLSEPWFMFGWAAVLLLWFGVKEPARLHDGHRIVLCLAIGVGVALTVLVRTQAIVLLPALGIGFVPGRFTWRERSAALAGAAAPLAAWAIYHQSLLARGPAPTGPDEASYLSWFAAGAGHLVPELMRIAGSNANTYVTNFGPYLMGVVSVGFLSATALLGGSVFFGVAALRREPVLAASAIGSVVLLLLWPFAQDRLLLSVMPFVGLAACAALAPVIGRWGAVTRRATGYAAAVAFCLVLVRQLDVRREGTSLLAGAPGKFVTPLRILLGNSLFEANMTRWITSSTTYSDRVMVDGGAGIYLYSGRATVQYSPTLNALAPAARRDEPGRYLASRIVDDTLTYVVAASSPEFAQAVSVVNARCPGTLVASGGGLPKPLVALKVRRDESCLSGVTSRPANPANR